MKPSAAPAAAPAPMPAGAASSRRAWLVYAAAVFAYVIAVMQRTTIGVAGVAATERFAVAATSLSTLAMVQLAVYAALQVPVGILIDRHGARVLLLGGTLVLAAGQLLVGLAPDITTAVVGRLLVGAGDAAIFTSVVRLTAAWFSGRVVAALNQWIGSLGQIGQVLSAVPFAALLQLSGWTVAFLSAAACSVLALIAIVIAVRDVPPGTLVQRTRGVDWRPLLVAAAREPGTWAGFWTAWTAQASGLMFVLMWGFPWMVYALGYAPATAAHLLIVTVAAGAIAGPVLGVLSGHFPARRVQLTLILAALMGAVWTALLAWPGEPPFALVVALLTVLGIGIPGGIMGFDHARAWNRPEGLGSANGVVNIGGFFPCVILILLVGFTLDLQHPGAAPERLYSLEAFRLAFLVQYPVIACGAFFLVRSNRRARRRERSGGDS